MKGILIENKIELAELLLEYEISASWWAQYISNDWLQELASRYFTWKVRRKMSRLLWARW